MKSFTGTSSEKHKHLFRLMALLLAAIFLMGCSAPMEALSVVESQDYVVDFSLAVTGTPVPIMLSATPSPEPPTSPTPTAVPTATPTPVPTATPAPTPEATATAKPTSTPKATAKPTATPKPTAKPTATLKPTAKPTATPNPTANPTKAPTATPGPTEPSLNTPPMAEITPTPKPTSEPTATPKPTAVPTDAPTATPSATKKPTVEVSGEYSYEDLELAARVAYFETGSDDGYKAVLSVIYHRCMSSKFGGKKTSIPTEVYRSSQFSVVRKSKFETTTAPDKIIKYADEVFNRGKTTVPETVLFFRAARLGTEWGTKVYYDTIGGNAYFHAG